MGCGASSESSQRGDSAGSSGTEAVVVTVAQLGEKIKAYREAAAVKEAYPNQATTAEEKAAYEAMVGALNSIAPEEHLKLANADDTALAKDYLEMWVAIIAKKETDSEEYKAIQKALEDTGLNLLTDKAECEAKLFTGTGFKSLFAESDVTSYDTATEICTELFAKKNGTFQQKMAELGNILDEVDEAKITKLESKIEAYLAAVAAKEAGPNPSTEEAETLAYKAMVDLLNDIPYYDAMLPAAKTGDVEYSENYLKMAVAIIGKKEENNAEYKSIKEALEANLLLDKDECEANLPTGFEEVLKKAGTGYDSDTAKQVCQELFTATDFEGKMDKLEGILDNIAA